MKFLSLATVLAAAAFLASCDSPELVRKRDQQSLELTKLKGELAVLEERLQAIPPDRTADLATVETEAKGQKEELVKMEEEIKTLEAKKAQIQKQFDDYKAKYVVR